MAKLSANIKTNSRELRKNQTDAEPRLWHHLRAMRFFNFRLRRQQVIGPYIGDFYSSRAKLIIELDGGQHTLEEAILYDQIRTNYLNDCDCKVIRFWNSDVIKNTTEVLTALGDVLNSPSPQASPARGEGEKSTKA